MYVDCASCGAKANNVSGGPEQPDPCIGFLPGVFNACCGHGDPDRAYITFGRSKYEPVHPRIFGPDALRIMRLMREDLGPVSEERWNFGGGDPYIIPTKEATNG